MTYLDNKTIVKYLLEALNNKYIDNILIDKVSDNLLKIQVVVNTTARIKPVLMMIEANMYTRKDLLAYSTKQFENKLIIKTFNKIEYNIEVISRKEQKNNEY